MGNKRKPRREHKSSSSPVSSSDEMSTEESTPRRRSSYALATAGRQRNNRKKEDKMIRMLGQIKEDTKKLTEDTSKMQKQINKLTESHNELRKQLEIRISGSISGDDSSAPRSETKQVKQPPKYRLEFTCEVNDEIEKGQIIETKNHGKTISIVMYDDHNQIVATGPFASARVMLVVVNGEFNQHGNQYNWSRKDFERNIKRPRKGNSAMEDEHQSVESIVSNCVFKLHGGVKRHSDATILYNSSNKKVRLGVMVLSPTEERVLEGLSNLFFVRGHDRPARQCDPHRRGSKGQKKAIVSYAHQEQNGSRLIMQNPSWSNLTQPEESRFNPAAETLQFPGNTVTEASASIPQPQFSHLGTTSIAPATYNLTAGNEQLLLSGGNFTHPNSTPHDYSTGSGNFPNPTNGTHFNMDQIALPVQLLWYRPNVEPCKRWNLLDQLMPLYSCQPKFNNCGLSTMRLMAEHYSGSLIIIPTEVMQIRRKRGVLVEPLEHDDSDEERSVKRKLQRKYLLRFVNKVCKAYHVWDQIKSYDGSLLKVSLFDENNMKVTSGPLSSASVEVVALHGDFNVDGQDYYTSEEFTQSVVCPRPGEEASSVLGGDRILVLADGEACLGDAFFQVTSFVARTGRFKMGVVMLASSHEERIQEGVSEPFLVKDYRPLGAGLPGVCFHPTEEQLFHYLRKRKLSTMAIFPFPDVVDIYKLEPWDVLARAKFGDREWYFFCHNPSSNHTTSSGYWKATSADSAVGSDDMKMLVLKKTLVFYKGRSPKGVETNWIMDEYRLADDNSTKDEWVLCRIFQKSNQLMKPSLTMDNGGMVLPPRDHSVFDTPINPVTTKSSDYTPSVGETPKEDGPAVAATAVDNRKCTTAESTPIVTYCSHFQW